LGRFFSDLSNHTRQRISLCPWNSANRCSYEAKLTVMTTDCQSWLKTASPPERLMTITPRGIKLLETGETMMMAPVFPISHYLISNTKDRLWPHSQTLRKMENAKRSVIFYMNIQVFGNLVKHCLECLAYLLNPNWN